jgi:hypothetical protein
MVQELFGARAAVNRQNKELANKLLLTTKEVKKSLSFHNE